jgi:hypothetical protein
MKPASIATQPWPPLPAPVAAIIIEPVPS